MTTVRDALTQLRSAQKKHAPGSPAYSVYVNRRLGRVFAAVAYSWSMTPNQVTLVSAICTFAGIALMPITVGHVWGGIAVALLLVLGYALDSADGQVARLRGGGSPAGEWLDHFVDAIKISALPVATFWGLSREWGAGDARTAVPLAFLVIANATFFGMILNDLLRSAHGVTSGGAREGGTFVRSMVLLPTDYGMLCLVYVLWGWPNVFVFAYGALMLVALVFLLMAAPRWFRAMSRLSVAA